MFPLQSAKVYSGIDNREKVVRFPASAREFPPLQIPETCCGIHPAFFQTGTGVASPRVKRPEREIDHSITSSSKITTTKNGAKYLLSHVLSLRALRKLYLCMDLYFTNTMSI
jgi:hypothetical protein